MKQLINSLLTTVIGMIVVFVSLIVIILFILLVNKIIALFTAEHRKEKIEPEVEISQDNEVNEEEKRKLVAAITAALAVSAFSGTNARFIVKKIKKL